jgi:ribose transport system substrate-binding protein
VASLGGKYAPSYVGFRDYPLQKSAWANWKPTRTSGWNVQVVWVPLTNPLTNAALAGLKQELKASGKVKTIQVQAVNAPTDVPQQLQQLQTAIERKPDLIILFPLAGAAAAPVVAKAGKAGIPTVAPSTGIPGPYAVGLNSNLYLSEGLAAAGVLGQMGGKGDVLKVHGIKGVPNDVIAEQAWRKVLSRCPNVKVAGTVEGQFDNTAAKAAVQKFLATHPSGVQGAFETGTMGPGILGAFTQTGRTAPPLADNAAAEGTLAYWHDHADYNMVATLTPQAELGQAAAKVALRMLEGDGVKLNTLLDKPYVVTQRAALDQVFKPSFKVGSVVGVPPPPGSFMADAYLDGFFAHSAK